MQASKMSSKSLLFMTAFWTILALVIYVTIILPAEFNKDPLGTGAVLGLTVLSENPDSEEKPTPTPDAKTSNISTSVTLAPGEGKEYKIKLLEYDAAEFSWQTASGKSVYSDLHGEPEGDTTGYYKSYAVVSASKMQGSFIAPFAGTHGWYWQNTNDEEVTIFLSVSSE